MAGAATSTTQPSGAVCRETSLVSITGCCDPPEIVVWVYHTSAYNFEIKKKFIKYLKESSW